MENLRRKGNFKRPAEKRGKSNDKDRTIKKRPKEIYKRQEIGHWEGILDLFKSLVNNDRTIIIVTHDINVAKQTDKIYKMIDGKLYLKN